MNIIPNKKSLLYNNNGSSIINKEKKLYKNGSDITFDNKKDTTINSTSYNFNNSLNNYVDYQQLRNISLYSIDDKYKYLENPFATPNIPKDVDEERRERIIEIINKKRNNRNKSQSVNKKNDDIQKRANYLGNQLFAEENEE